MSEMTVGDMSAQYMDVLKELGNIGAGNAATALAELLQSKVDMSVPQVKLINFSQIGELIGGEEQVMAGMYLAIQKDITGSILFLVKEEVALHLVKKLMGDYAQDIRGEMEQSALKEISNIITGAYLNSLSTLTNLKIFPTPPQLTVDMASAILSVPAIYFGTMGDKILLIQSQFYDEVEIDGYFILIPDLDSYSKILTSLGIPVL